MNRVALAIAAALLWGSRLAVAQMLPPPENHVAPQAASTELPADDDFKVKQEPPTQTPSSIAPVSPNSGSTEIHAAESQPLPKPPLVGDSMVPIASSFPDLSMSPAGYRVWAGAETLLWWEKRESLPANLVTSGLPTDAVPGAAGQPNTVGLS